MSARHCTFRVLEPVFSRAYDPDAPAGPVNVTGWKWLVYSLAADGTIHGQGFHHRRDVAEGEAARAGMVANAGLWDFEPKEGAATR